ARFGAGGDLELDGTDLAEGAAHAVERGGEHDAPAVFGQVVEGDRDGLLVRAVLGQAGAGRVGLVVEHEIAGIGDLFGVVHQEGDEVDGLVVELVPGGTQCPGAVGGGQVDHLAARQLHHVRFRVRL